MFYMKDNIKTKIKIQFPNFTYVKNQNAFIGIKSFQNNSSWIALSLENLIDDHMPIS